MGGTLQSYDRRGQRGQLPGSLAGLLPAVSFIPQVFHRKRSKGSLRLPSQLFRGSAKRRDLVATSLIRRSSGAEMVKMALTMNAIF